LQVDQGEFLVLVGPSGCGKSTLLRSIAGLENLSDGQIVIDGKDVSNSEPRDRNLAMVFQNYALYPHLSVHDNLAFALKMRHMEQQEITERVKMASNMLGLDKLLERKPRQLSGGQRQRVALGRAIVRRPHLFLFDEPLSNLDAKLRNHMRLEIKKLHKVLGNTMIYVTHDQIEATTLGDRIAVLEGGRIQQIDTPENIYNSPSNLFVAGFIGVPEMNLIKGSLSRFKRVLSPPEGAPSEVMLGLRPENLKVDRGADKSVLAEGKILLIENLGGQHLLHVQYNAEIWRVIESQKLYHKEGDLVKVKMNEGARMHWFDPKSGHRL